MDPTRNRPTALIFGFVTCLLFGVAGTAAAGMPPLDWSVTTTSNVYWYSGTADASGNAIAVGWITITAQNDWLVRKYNQHGATVWEDVYAGPSNNDDAALSVITDPAGNVIAGGRTYVTGQDLNWMLRKYDPNGTILWTRTYNSPGNSLDEIWTVAVDSNGDIIAAGHVDRVDLGQAANWLVAKYRGTDGALLWSRTYNGPVGSNNNDGCYGLTTDDARNVYAVGFESVNGGAATYWRMFKYDSDGNVLWSRSNPGRPGNTDSRAERVGIDLSGNLIVGGHDIVNTWPDYDWLVCRYDPSGNLLWQKSYAGPGLGMDDVRGLAIRPDGTALLSGFQTASGTGRDWLLRAYDTAGTILWSFTLGGALLDEMNGLGLDACDGIYLIGKYGNGSRVDRYTSIPNCNAPALSVIKSVTPGTAATGSPVTYTILATNTSGTVISDIEVVDTLPAQFVFASQASSPPLMWNGNASIAVWTGSGLAIGPGQTATVTINGTASSCVSATVFNTASVTAANASGYDRKSATAALAVVVPTLAMSVVKTQIGGAGAGEPITYHIAVTNTGTATITGLTVVDTFSPLVAGMSAVTPPGWAAPSIVHLGVAGGTRYIWSNAAASLAPGSSTTFTLSGTVWLVCTPQPLFNTAVVAARTSCAQLTVLSNTVGGIVQPPAPGLSIVKTQVPASPVTGGPVSYQIVVTNTGATTVTSLVVVDTVSPVVTAAVQSTPAGFTAQAVAQGPSGTVYSWMSSAAFLPGASATFQLDGTVGPVCTGTVVSNTAYCTASTACSATRMASGTSSFLLAGPTLAITVVKTRTPAVPAIGSAVGYEIVVTNAGTATVDDVTVVDTVSGVITGVVTTEPGGFGAPVVTSTASGTRYVWSASAPGLLPLGGTLTFRIDGAAGLVCAATTVDNKAYAAAGAACNTTRSFSALDTFVVAGSSPILAAAMSLAPAAPSSGGAVRYTIVVTNQGIATATDLTVVDTLPEGVTFSAQSAGGGLVWNGSRTVPGWSGLVNLAPGQSLTITLEVTASATFSGSVANTAWAYAVGGCGSAQASVTASFTLTPPDELGGGQVRIVGGIRGYIQPRRGEQATILVRPVSAGQITVRIYDLQGNLVRELTAAASGGHTEVLHWDARDSAGRDVAPGAYPILIEAPGIRYRDTLAVLR